MKKWGGIELEVGRIYKRGNHGSALCLSGLKKREMANCSPDPTQQCQLDGAGVGLKEDTMDTVLPDLTQTAHMWFPAKPTADIANCSHTLHLSQGQSSTQPSEPTLIWCRLRPCLLACSLIRSSAQGVRCKGQKHVVGHRG